MATSPTAQAGQEKVLDGCYVPTRGDGESATFLERNVNGDIDADGQYGLPMIQQLGRFEVKLTRADWSALSGEEKRRTVKKLILEGPFRGKCFPGEDPNFPGGVNPCATLNHSLGSDDRIGFVFTSGDFAVPLGAEFCDDSGGLELTILETLFPIAGDGAYARMDPTGSYFQVEGTVNECTGRNDFVVLPGEGQICFTSGE